MMTQVSLKLEALTKIISRGEKFPFSVSSTSWITSPQRIYFYLLTKAIIFGKLTMFLE